MEQQLNSLTKMSDMALKNPIGVIRENHDVYGVKFYIGEFVQIIVRDFRTGKAIICKSSDDYCTRKYELPLALVVLIDMPETAKLIPVYGPAEIVVGKTYVVCPKVGGQREVLEAGLALNELVLGSNRVDDDLLKDYNIYELRLPEFL